MALSSVVGLPIKSVYSPMNGTQCKAHNALSKPFVTDDTKNRETLTVMWSRMGPWRPPTWTGNHFVPILKQEQRTKTKAVDEQKKPLEQRPQAPDEKKQQPTTASTVEMKRNEVLTPVPKKHDQFQLNEISTPISSFVIKDILGNDTKVTPIAKPAHKLNDPPATELNIDFMETSSVHFSDDNESKVTPIAKSAHESNEQPETEINNDYMETSSVHFSDDTKQMNLDNSPMNNKNVKDTLDNDMVTDITELNDSTEIETSRNSPVPENINPLPNGRWHKAEDIYTLIKEKKYVHTEVPPGNKSNCYMLVDNKRNVERVKQNKKSEFYDDCGVWMTQKGRTVKSYYYLVEGNLVCCELKKDQYCVRKEITARRHECH